MVHSSVLFSLGGRLDNIIMRTIDVLMSFPYVLLALAIVAVLGPSLMNALIAVAIVNIPFLLEMLEELQ